MIRITNSNIRTTSQILITTKLMNKVHQSMLVVIKYMRNNVNNTHPANPNCHHNPPAPSIKNLHNTSPPNMTKSSTKLNHISNSQNLPIRLMTIFLFLSGNLTLRTQNSIQEMIPRGILSRRRDKIVMREG